MSGKGSWFASGALINVFLCSFNASVHGLTARLYLSHEGGQYESGHDGLGAIESVAAEELTGAESRRSEFCGGALYGLHQKLAANG